MSRAVVLGIAALVGLALLVILTVREGSDHTVIGTVTAVQSHRLCVDPPDAAQVCVMADSPAAIRDVKVGDCVRIRYSADEILMSAEPVIDPCY